MTLTDAMLDAELPPGLRWKAWMHFTPVAVARGAVALLAPAPNTAVLDVGAGAGKFCLVAAAAYPATTFVGIEQRPPLVRIATRLARQLGLPNTEFHAGDAFALDWQRFAGFYFYNPFTEQTLAGPLVLDREGTPDPTGFMRDLEATRTRLAVAGLGTRVVTYHGFGAPPPAGYDQLASVPIGTDRLELWVKAR